MSNILFSNKENDSNNQKELTGEDSLKLLVGEGKKYATVEDMAKGMVHGQNHITNLEQEATAFKANAQKQSSIDDILAAIKKGGGGNDDNNNQQKSDEQGAADQQQQAANQQVDIATQIKDALAAQSQSQQANVNVQLVTDSLSKSLGNRANEVYTSVGKSLGVDLDELAKTSPEAVIKLCTGQATPAQQQGNLPQGTFTPSQQNTSLNGELNYKGIQELFAKGNMSREKKFQLEMSQALKLGDSFYNK